MNTTHKTPRTPKYRKHSTRDFAFIEWQGDRHRLPGRHGSAESWEAYRKFIREVVFGDALPTSPRVKPGDPVSVCILVDAYLIFAEQHYSSSGPRGEYANMKHALMPLAAKFSDTPVAQFGPLMLKDLQRDLAKQKLGRNYVNSQISRIKRAFKWGVSEELVPPAIYQALSAVAGLRAGRSLAVEKPKRQPAPAEAVDATLTELSPTLAAMVRFQRLIGCRSDSLCNAAPEQFDQSGEQWLWRPKHKTQFLGRELVLPIGPQAQAIIGPFIDRRRPGEHLFSPREARRNRLYRPRYSSQSYAQAIQRAIKRVNAKRAKEKLDPIQEWTPHQLRHSRGHETRERYGVEAAQAILGHDTLDATQIYSARRLELAKQVARETG